MPHDREALEALPGVGRKTANVVLNIGFGEPMIAVDTHIFRVANRTAAGPGKTPRRSRTGWMKLVPDRFKLHAHHWLILHGRYVCKARRPAVRKVPDRRFVPLCGEDGVAGGVAGPRRPPAVPAKPQSSRLFDNVPRL